MSRKGFRMKPAYQETVGTHGWFANIILNYSHSILYTGWFNVFRSLQFVSCVSWKLFFCAFTRIANMLLMRNILQEIGVINLHHFLTPWMHWFVDVVVTDARARSQHGGRGFKPRQTCRILTWINSPFAHAKNMSPLPFLLAFQHNSFVKMCFKSFYFIFKTCLKLQHCSNSIY